MGKSIRRSRGVCALFMRLRAPLPPTGAKIQSKMQADVAQLVEQLIRNQQVVSSSLTVGSRIRMTAWPLECERSFLSMGSDLGILPGPQRRGTVGTPLTL